MGKRQPHGEGGRKLSSVPTPTACAIMRAPACCLDILLTTLQSPGIPIQDSIEELLLGKADNANRAFGDTHRHLVQNSVGFYVQDDWKIKPRLTVTLGLRYDIFGNLRDRDNVAANFFPDRGLVQVGEGYRSSLQRRLSRLRTALGFAWDIFGNGRTASAWRILSDLRCAQFRHPRFSIFAWPGLAREPSLSPTSVCFPYQLAGTRVQVNPDLPPNYPAATCFNPATGAGDYICFSKGPVFGSSPTGEPPFDAFSVVQNFKTPRTHNFSLSLQHELFRNNVLTVGYSGQRGSDLVIDRDLNASPLGGGDRPFADQFPDLHHIVQATNLGDSQYDSLQASYSQRGWHGIDTSYNFTWSKCFDESSFNRGGIGDYPQAQNPLNVQDSRGLCDHDVRLNFNVGGVYSLPTIRARRRAIGQRMATEHDLHGHQRPTIQCASGRWCRSFWPRLVGEFDSRLMGWIPGPIQHPEPVSVHRRTGHSGRDCRCI